MDMWIMKKFFKGYHIKITENRCWVHKDPDFNSKNIYMVYKNSIYTVVEQVDNWGKLKAGGWIHLSCTTKYKLPTKSSGIIVL